MTPETSPKSVPEADVAGKIKVSVAAAVAAISSKYEAIMAHQSETAAEAYGTLQGELKSLQAEYDAAKAELATVTAELTALKALEQK